MQILMLILPIILAYLVGSINGSLVLGRFKNVDIRQAGSGNAGGTNAFRTQGLAFALAVIVIDIGKAVLVVFLASRFLPSLLVNAGALTVDRVVCLVAAAVVVGHCYPIWHGFKGGKGVATFAGVVIALIPEYFPVILLIILSLLILTGYVSFASMVSSLIVPIIYAVTQPNFLEQALFWCLVCIACFVVFTHRGNIQKLLSGTENRFEKVRLLHRLLNK